MLSNGNLPHHMFDLTDELSLGLEHVENLVTLALDADDSSVLATLLTFAKNHVGQLRTLLQANANAEGGAR